MAPIKEVEFPGGFIRNLRSWYFHQPTRTGFPLGQGSPGKSWNLLEDQGKVRAENFYSCKFLTLIKKSYAHRNMCAVELYMTINCIYDAIICI